MVNRSKWVWQLQISPPACLLVMPSWLGCSTTSGVGEGSVSISPCLIRRLPGWQMWEAITLYPEKNPSDMVTHTRILSLTRHLKPVTVILRSGLVMTVSGGSFVIRQVNQNGRWIVDLELMLAGWRTGVNCSHFWRIYLVNMRLLTGYPSWKQSECLVDRSTRSTN